MKEIIKKITELLDSKNNNFTKLKLIKEGFDGEINLEYEAVKPKRNVDVEFNSEKEILDYLNSL